MAKKTIPVLRQHELISFGRRLRSWRKARRLSQEKLALTAGLDYSYVNEIENGKINLGLLTLLSLAQTLEIPPAALLLPVEQVRKLQNMPVLQVEDLESTFIHTLALPELLDIHCQFLLNYARAGHFKLARQWLEIYAALAFPALVLGIYPGPLSLFTSTIATHFLFPPSRATRQLCCRVQSGACLGTGAGLSTRGHCRSHARKPQH